MNRKLLFLIGILTVSLMLVFVSISEVKANGEEGGNANLKFVMIACVCPHGDVYGYSNDCDPGSNHCISGTWEVPPCLKDGSTKVVDSE